MNSKRPTFHSPLLIYNSVHPIKDVYRLSSKFLHYMKPYTSYNNTHNHIPISAVAFKPVGSIQLLTATQEALIYIGKVQNYFFFTPFQGINTIKVLAVYFAVK